MHGDASLKKRKIYPAKVRLERLGSDREASNPLRDIMGSSHSFRVQPPSSCFDADPETADLFFGDQACLKMKFLRLKTPVTINSRFGDWRVCWLGGWTRDRLSYLVMLVRATKPDQEGHLRLLCHGSDAHLSDPA